MLLTYRYKLQPTKKQYVELDRICEQQRILYNAALQERVDAWRKAKISITKLNQFKSLTKIRSFDESFAAVPVALSRWSISRVDDAFKGFFSRAKTGKRAGFPRFKPISRWRSFGFAEWDGIRLKNNKLLFKPFTDGVKLKMHRSMPERCSLKSCTITRSSRHWLVAIAIDVPVDTVHTAADKIVGLDAGTEHLLTTSDGRHIENIRPRSQYSKLLQRAQRALARCKRGSRRRVKVRERLIRIQSSVANTRNTYLHQVSAHLTRQFGFIAVEKLQVKNMTRSAKGTAEDPGTNVRQKAGLNSSSCGERVRKKLAQRMHVCSCGTVLQRDHNAALNILYRALDEHGRARPPGDANVGHWLMRCLGNMVVEAA